MTSGSFKNLPAIAAVATALAAAAGASGQITGPSSSQEPYVDPVATGVRTISVLTVGDAAGAYLLAGHTDGLGALPTGDGTFTLFVNHEMTPGEGAIHAHGADGAFVSSWTIDAVSLAVLDGADLIQQVGIWSIPLGQYTFVAAPLSRLCSADLPPQSAFFDAATSLGETEPIFTNGEESGTEGRAFAHLVTGPNTGRSYQLPRLGRANWENVVAAPGAGDQTVVVLLDDSSTGQVYVYIGQKAASGIEIERAGLTSGALYGVKVTGVPTELIADGLGGVATRPFTLHSFGNVTAQSGTQLQNASLAAAVTAFRRPEDGHWDPRNPADFYFVTTGSGGAPGRLWRLRFASLADPVAGGTIELLLTGSEGVVAPDNITIDVRGHVLIEEDAPASRLSRLWMYDIAADTVTELGRAAARFFDPAGAEFLTESEELSGVIDAAEILGHGWFLLDVQAHYDLPAPLVEGGQILALFAPQTLSRGDANCDGVIDFFDIDPLLLALFDPAGYAAAYPRCAALLADMDDSGVVDFADVDPFLAALFGG